MTSIAQENIKFSDLRDRYNADGGASLSSSGPIKLSDFTGCLMKEGTYSYHYEDLFFSGINRTSETSIGSIFRGNTFSDKPVLRNVGYDYYYNYDTDGLVGLYPRSHVYASTLGSIHTWEKTNNLEDNDYLINYLRVIGNGTIKMKFHINTQPFLDYAIIYIFDSVLSVIKVYKEESGFYPNDIDLWYNDTSSTFTEYNVKAGDWIIWVFKKDGSVGPNAGLELFKFYVDYREIKNSQNNEYVFPSGVSIDPDSTGTT